MQSVRPATEAELAAGGRGRGGRGGGGVASAAAAAGRRDASPQFPARLENTVLSDGQPRRIPRRPQRWRPRVHADGLRDRRQVSAPSTGAGASAPAPAPAPQRQSSRTLSVRVHAPSASVHALSASVHAPQRKFPVMKAILIHGNGGSTTSDLAAMAERELTSLGLTVINRTFPDNVKARARSGSLHRGTRR